MVDLGQKKVNIRLPFFIRKSLGWRAISKLPISNTEYKFNTVQF